MDDINEATEKKLKGYWAWLYEHNKVPKKLIPEHPDKEYKEFTTWRNWFKLEEQEATDAKIIARLRKRGE